MKQAPLQVKCVTSATELRTLGSAANLPPFDATLLDQHRPDAHWVAVARSGASARCSLWWRDTPPYLSHRVGLVGHYAAATKTAAEALLRRAVDELAANGCTLAVAPVDGSTWRNYRFVVEPGDAPRFLLEPHNAAEWPRHFTDVGFVEFAGYFSAVAEDLSRTFPRVERVQRRMDESGVRIRCVADDRFEADVRQIHAVVESSFNDHLLFAPLDESEFLAQCSHLRGIAPLDLVFVAEQSDTIVGFCFGLPDLLQAERGEPNDTVILKTLGVLPGRQFAGLGQLLLERLHRRAHELGYRRVIHALVRETGSLERLSARYATPFRRYLLLAKELGR